MKKIPAILISGILIIVSVFAMSCGGSSHNQYRILQSIRQNVQNELNKMDQDAAAAAEKLSESTLTETQIRPALSGILQGRPYIADAALINRTGTLQFIEPEEYQRFEGSDISGQEQVIRLFQTEKPVLSQEFMSIEGFGAADLEQPVFSQDGQITAAFSVLLRPDELLSSIISPIVRDTPFSVTVVQPDGLDIFDTDAGQIGKNTFMDPAYQSFPKLIDLARVVTAKPTGSGQYEYLDATSNQTVSKKAVWDTVALHGTEWRIVLISKNS